MGIFFFKPSFIVSNQGPGLFKHHVVTSITTYSHFVKTKPTYFYLLVYLVVEHVKVALRKSGQSGPFWLVVLAGNSVFCMQKVSTHKCGYQVARTPPPSVSAKRSLCLKFEVCGRDHSASVSAKMSL